MINFYTGFIEFFNRTPFYLISLWILIVTFLCAWAVNFIFKIILDQILKRTPADLDNKITECFKSGFFYTIITVGVYSSFTPFPAFGKFKNFLGSVFFSIGVVVWGWVAIRIVAVFLESVQQKYRREEKRRLEGIFPFLENILRLIIIVLMVLMMLGAWGVNITPFLASAGVVGVAVAFAAKDTVANFFGGLSVFLDHPYKVGDYLVVNDTYRGKVIEIGMRSTKIKTRDDILLTVPNSVMVTGVVVNETGHDGKLRIRIPIGVDYGSDLKQVERVLIEEMQDYSEILAEPKPRVHYRGFGPSTIDLEALGVLKNPGKRGLVVHKLIKRIHSRFEKEKIKMPPPLREVYLHSKN